MISIEISWIGFACVFGGALLGMFLRVVLPEHHLSTDSKDVIKLWMGLVGTISAFVLGLLIASAMGSYNTQRSELTQMSTNIILLDGVLAQYGPETKEARGLLRRTVATAHDRIWLKKSSQSSEEPGGGWSKVLYEIIKVPGPKNDAQRLIQAQAVSLALNLTQTRWLMFEQESSQIPRPFLVILLFWVTIIFNSFGLFARPNATVIASLFVCALSVSAAVYLILDMDQPFTGLIQVSSAPLRDALAHLGQ
jgi:hypothetical protein